MLMLPDEQKIMRLDAALVARGLAVSRERAKEQILAGEVLVNGVVVRKASAAVKIKDSLRCEGEAPRYVGRGGFKLEKALAVGGYSLQGVCALDIGASTGGFTDCMLQNGARLVYAVDVGHGQLHPKLLEDTRVRNLEGTDIRDTVRLKESIPLSSMDFCSIDVSFISVAKVFGSIIPFLKPGADIVCLIKPQFEAGREAVGKKGIVKDKKAHCRVIDSLCAYFQAQGCIVRGLTFSPVPGGDGNIEYLALLQYGSDIDTNTAIPVDAAAVVEEAHRALKQVR